VTQEFTTRLPAISVLMAVHQHEQAKHLTEAFQSLESQTAPPVQVVLVCDGPPGSHLERVIADFAARLPLNVVRLPESAGLAAALNEGLKHCRGQMVARADSDDINLPTRFERQARFLESEPHVSIVGSWIQEIEGSPAQLLRVRKLPEKHAQIQKYARYRSPLNHNTVMFRASALNLLGAYPDLHRFEDYGMWLRALSMDLVLHNLQESLVLARAGAGLIDRRSGLAYLAEELVALRYFWRERLLDKPALLMTGGVRIGLRLLPRRALSIIYQRFLRNEL
jgi:glycosyltransferase involved in cell wall biosynthesis